MRHVKLLFLIVTVLWIIDSLFACIGDLGGNHTSSDCFACLKRQEPEERGAQPDNALGIDPPQRQRVRQAAVVVWSRGSVVADKGQGLVENITRLQRDFLPREPRRKLFSDSTTISQLALRQWNIKQIPSALPPHLPLLLAPRPRLPFPFLPPPFFSSTTRFFVTSN